MKDEAVLGAVAKIVSSSLRHLHAIRQKYGESVEEVDEQIETGLLRTWLSGLTEGRQSSHGGTVSVIIGRGAESKARLFFKAVERLAAPSRPLTIKVVYTNAGPEARFIWHSLPASPEALVRHGYPVEVAKVLAIAFELRPAELLTAIGVPARTAARRISEDKVLKSDESDRLFRAGNVMYRALDIFGDLDRAREFLTKANPSLGGVTPLSLLDTVPGRDRVLSLLGQIEHGVYA